MSLTKQQGTLLIELLVVVVIVAMLASFAMPGMQTSVINNDLSNGQKILTQTLRKARLIARAEGRFMLVRLHQGSNQIFLQRLNGDVVETVQLPPRTFSQEQVEFTFSPNGTIGRIEDEIVVNLAEQRIELVSTSSTSNQKTTTQINRFGNIASL
ncbi:MAG: hypothetical protein OEY38_05775 [Gammaproteobacteria bacterium]|nr:hypothetical protein [Gammaproteobacteria bacterium]